MDLFELQTFVAVVREGSFSKAARALYRTQPAISQIIQRLETDIGQPLFDRSSRRGVLSDAGRVLLVHAERLLALRDRALAAVDDVRHQRSGHLVIGCNELTCLYLLPLLDQFRRRFPAVQLSVRRGLASRIPAEVREFGADLGVVTYRPMGDELSSVVVYRDQLAFVVPRTHRLSRRRELKIHDLADQSFIAHHVASPYRAKVVDTFQKRRVTLQMPVEMPTIDAIKRFVLAGHGVALLPAIAVEQEIARGELVRIRVRELAFERPVRLVWRKAGTPSAAAAAFLQIAEAYAESSRGRYLFSKD